VTAESAAPAPLPSAPGPRRPALLTPRCPGRSRRCRLDAAAPRLSQEADGPRAARVTRVPAVPPRPASPRTRVALPRSARFPLLSLNFLARAGSGEAVPECRDAGRAENGVCALSSGGVSKGYVYLVHQEHLSPCFVHVCACTMQWHTWWPR
jgi:hypothetical protein